MKKKKKPTCRRRKRLTPRFFIALLSSLTTSIPSTPPALKRFVHVIRKPCTQTDETVNGKVSQRKSTTYRTVQGSELFPSPFNAREPCLEAWSLFYLIQFGLLTGEGEGESHRKFLVFDVLFFHEVTETLCHMVEQLEQRWKEGEGELRSVCVCVCVCECVSV